VWSDLILKESSLLTIQKAIERGSSLASAFGIPRLADEASLDVVEDAVVVILGPESVKGDG
jgi:hypothetical protein